MTLSELAPRRRCRVLSAAADDAELQSRLYALGLYPGVEVEILRVAPAGDPMQVSTGTSLLSVRVQEASLIQVETTDD